MTEPKYGVIELYVGSNPQVDIVAVHGLYENALQTWTSDRSNALWLRDAEMLPKVIPNARILTWGYNTDVHAFLGHTSSNGVIPHAPTLVAQLQTDRENEGATERPILFVCHGFGGLIVKRALAYSASRTSKNEKHLHSIFVSTYGVLFLGTPHNGSNVARTLSTAQRLGTAFLPKKGVDTYDRPLDALKEGSETLQNLTAQFAPLMERFHIYFFWEQEKTDLPHTKAYIVEYSSAAPILDDTERCGIGANHSGMCKFEDSRAPGYRTVAAALMRYARDAPSLVAARWSQAKEASESMGSPLG